MVEVKVSRLVTEVVAAEGTVAGATRVDVQVAAQADAAVEIYTSRLAVEVLGQEPDVAGTTRVDVQIAARTDAAVEVLASRLAAEVLGAEPATGAITRVDVQVAARTYAAVEVLASRISIECLARQGSAGPVVPLPVADDSHVFLHNWASKVELSSAFLTDVKPSPASGAESRRGLSVKPSRTMRLKWLLADGADLEELERLEVVLRRMTDQRFQVPIYQDQQELEAPYLASDSIVMVATHQGRFFVGARVALVRLSAYNQIIGSSYHIISDMTNNSLTFASPLGVDVPAGSLVFPVLDCEATLKVKADFITARVPQVSLTVAEAPGSSQLPAVKSDHPSRAALYQGRPVLSIEPDWSRKVAKGRSRLGGRVVSGRAGFVDLAGDRSRQTHTFAISGDRDDMWAAIEFFETRRGRLRSFWHTDQDQYMTVVNLDATGNFIEVSEIGDLADFQEEFTHVGLVMSDGTVYVRQAVTIQQVFTTFRITVDEPIGLNLNVSDVVRVARARLTRFDKDVFREQWTHTGLMNSTIQIIETLDEQDYPTT